jgi:hypothetical protein
LFTILIIRIIKKEFTAEAAQETAFKVFSSKMDLWWPKTHHIGNSDMIEIVVEPYVSGSWYTKHTDGSNLFIVKGAVVAAIISYNIVSCRQS